MVQGRPKRGKRRAVGRRAARAHRRGGHARPVEETILRLRHIRSAVLVAVAALRRQNCELDEDIAILLQRCVCDPLNHQLEALEAARGGAVWHRPSVAADLPARASRARALAGARTR